jgi:8-oxo-dGTP pyrophosphatase MutT (NUDIX family)
MIVPESRLLSALEAPATRWAGRPGLRDAAVLLPWFTDRGEDWILYTMRRHDLPTHPGEVSFPGGAREGAESPIDCALRETEEEIGLSRNRVQVLGSLPAMVSIGGFFVEVVFGRIDHPGDLALDPGEVAEAFAIPLRQLSDQDRWESRRIPAPPFARTMPFFVHEGRDLWGLTALFTLELLGRLGFETPAPRIEREH